MKKIISLALALILIMAVFGGCGAKAPSGSAAPAPAAGSTAAPSSGGGAAAPPPPPVVKIGLLHSLTGPNASVGSEFVGTVMAAVDIINNAHPELGDFPFAKTEGLPGLGGAKIEVIVADTQSNPEIAATEAERLITSEGVVAIAGGHLSGVAKTASLSTEKLSIPYINGTATSPPLTERGLKYFFRATPSDETYSRNAFEFLDAVKSQYGIETVAICVEEAEYGKLQQEYYTRNANERGYKIVENFTYPSAPASVTSEAIRIKSANPDVLFMASQTSEAILFVQAFKQLDVRPKIMMTGRGGFISPEWFAACGSDTNFITTINAWSLDLANVKPFISDINKIVKQHAGCELNGDYAREFDAFMILADAINRAGAADSAAIHKALIETDLSAEYLACPWPGVKFDEKGQNIYGDGIITQVQDKKYVTVWPEEFASADRVLPMPPW